MELAALNGLSDSFSDPDLAEVSGIERASAGQTFDKVNGLLGCPGQIWRKLTTCGETFFDTQSSESRLKIAAHSHSLSKTQPQGTSSVVFLR